MLIKIRSTLNMTPLKLAIEVGCFCVGLYVGEKLDGDNYQKTQRIVHTSSVLLFYFMHTK